MRLADFILANIEPILMDWEVFARGIWPGEATDPATLRDDAEDIICAVGADMKSDQSAAQQSDKAKGGASGPQSQHMDRASVAHGVGRVASGFKLTAVMAEYRALRASAVRLWRESTPNPDVNDLEDLTRFNESIDQSLSEAVDAYNGQLERDRQAAIAEKEARGREMRSLNEALLISSVKQHELTEQANHAVEALQEAKEQAESANHAKDRFLAVLSHELRTPLTPVVMTMAAIEIDPKLPLGFRDDVVMMRRNIDLEVKLIDDLLDISRVISGKLPLHLQPIRVHELLSHVLRSSISDASAKRLNIHQELLARNDRLAADPARLQQVFWNLLRNALKFTPEGGSVTVRTWNAKDGQLYIEVRDTGVGIEKNVMPRIFDAFEQGELQITRQFGGLGLGLAIAKAVVQMHGGSLTACSEGRNLGATFTVVFQIDPIPEGKDSHAPAPIPGRETPATPLRILLVEDHPDTARVLATLLKRRGYEVTTAGSVDSALQFAATQTFDIVVSDIGLPDATGYELMSQIKKKYGTKGIALSGYGMQDDVQKSLEAGFVDHIVKPVDVAQLQAVIQRVLGVG